MPPVALAVAALLAASQPPLRWSTLAAEPGVDSAQRAWVEAHLPPAERDELAALVGALSTPSAAQLLASYLHADGSVHVPFTPARALADSFAVRPPEGAAGAMRVAYLAARLRVGTLDGWERLGVWARGFGGPPPVATAAAHRP
ncbi:hypothetical protein, partial [Roseisolibacter sp. H3M3-2]|uniref:hypothetical protein n=1 Tax=Roseisolibacter sp. H3M3-2 TaxID=3031323 RepID=UPI0023DAB47A